MLKSNTPTSGVHDLPLPKRAASNAMTAASLEVNPAPGEPGHAILAEIAAGLSAGRDLGELLQRFLEPVVRLAGAQAGAVRVLSDTGERLDLVSQIGVSTELCRAERSADRHCGSCGAAADGPRAVWTADLSRCQTAAGGAAAPAALGQRMLAVPLQHRGRVLGVYSLHFTGREEPAPDVLALLKSVGELLGLALDNARLEAENLRATLTQERQMMAAEVHDSVAQSLAFVKMRMPLLHDAMVARDDARAQQYFDDVRGAVTQAHSSLRGILTHFRSPMDPQGLLHALGACTETFRRSSGAELEFVNELPNLKLAPEREAQVFHIVQEALTNVARHAAAQHAWLHVGPGRRGEVEIVVEDDGGGLPPTAPGAGQHYGMEIMLERARRIGGTLEVGARASGGTRVRLAFPLEVTQPAAGFARGH
jgi:two-component system nitrate/nitrite sensor histidine kinase NarX